MVPAISPTEAQTATEGAETVAVPKGRFARLRAGLAARPRPPPSTGQDTDAAARGGMFAALGVPNFRLFVSAQTVSNVGSFMATVAQDWLVLQVSHDNPTVLGITTAAQFLPSILLTLWAGSLTGTMITARLSGRLAPRHVLGAGLALGALNVTLALMPTYTLFAAVLVPTGIALMIFSPGINSLVQLSVSPEMRGRISGLYVLLLYAGNALDGPMTSLLTNRFGGRAPLLFGGVVAVLAVVVATPLLRRTGNAAARVRSMTESDEHVRAELDNLRRLLR